jgi:hypothetical protein
MKYVCVQCYLEERMCHGEVNNVLHDSRRTVSQVARAAIVIYIYGPWAPPPTWVGCGLREGPVPLGEYSGDDLNLETGHPD